MITVFKRPNCAYCPMVVKYLTHINVEFHVREAEGEFYNNLAQKFGVSVPLVYNQETGDGMTGYNIARLKEIAGV